MSDTAKPFDVQAFIAQSVEGLRAATSAHCATWHLDEAEQWSVDMDSGLIVFQLPGGLVATSPVQIIGTSNSEDASFLWGWGHPSVPAELSEHAQLAQAFGQAHGLDAYTTRKTPCDDDKAWEFVAVAMRLGEASGAYRAQASETAHVWMTFGEVSLSKSEER
ncbi:DUF6882 domain-containing protein [Achromobacter deleyi]|uniref:DUF6882 domain-containing protein n=1 Tax=Achromobacter deleyi TaxID=1353891 RepID=UPI001492A8D1|nr:DUF6882 domain-containing protein [Achromobacter deleyi]QVQ27813.1 hypothetical protein HLG70_05030 [Achromobacter deleyi]UIP23417.1 hypothetical protein LYZ39_13145 [Achromobacter deleyi]